ncbi:cytochrome P450 [Absidia repens]|uniref:Cytochrome P450 n=1 Tax=Absidia repens TaxID=90262 RepID=A0A1X2IF22_9FUNG|nr:cytochrome P450 [Absidia repens]
MSIISQWIEEHGRIEWLLTRLRGKRTIGISMAIAVLYVLHRKITQPPARLRHLPHVGFYTFYKAILSNITEQRYSKEICLPLMEKSPGAYVRPGFDGWSIQLTDPIAIKQLLSKPYEYPKYNLSAGRKGTLTQRFIGGANVAFSNGDVWSRQRKIVVPAFNRSMPIKLFGELTTVMIETMEQKSGRNINVADLFSRFTIDALGQGVGFDFAALTDPNNKWVHAYESIKEGMFDPFFLVFPSCDTTFLSWFPQRAQLHQHLTQFLGMLQSVIDEKRAAENDNRDEKDRDLLTLMLDSNQNETTAMSDEELLTNLCVFFLAGHDTTAYSLTFMIYELAVNQDIQEKARKEAIDILGDEASDILPTIDQMKKMTYINAVIKETLRLHNPAVNSNPREVSQDCHLNGIFIPKGSLVTADILDMHRNPAVWNSPTTFDPDRFLPGGEAEQQSPAGLAWGPFLGGSRVCLGMNFSLIEQRVALSMLLRKYKWKLPENSIHTNGLKAHGLALGILAASDLLIDFEKRY